MSVPANPKIYHIVHVDRLPSIIKDGFLWCDAEIVERSPTGTTIGISGIKQRRLNELALNNHPGLHVGDCVPFYFCPRSVMLYILYQANRIELTYRGGQGPIIHLQADLRQTVAWAEKNNLRWAFTLSNAATRYFEDRSDLTQLNEINWSAVRAVDWRNCRDAKQAEFLIEKRFPWELVSRIGLRTPQVRDQVNKALQDASYKPQVEIKAKWYY